MRLLLRLDAGKHSGLPLNYHYPLSAAIYRLLRFGSAEFSSFLHDTGCKSGDRTCKFFSYNNDPYASQNVIISRNYLGGSATFAFMERMLSSVFTSERAMRMNIHRVSAKDG
jgi:CRISPR/Cas system endoribonuclease Cas6 (RAMP superfamily)